MPCTSAKCIVDTGLNGAAAPAGFAAHGSAKRPQHKVRAKFAVAAHIKQEMDFLFGSTILTAPDGTQLACDHLRHGDDWRLRCKRPDSKEVVMQRVKE